MRAVSRVGVRFASPTGSLQKPHLGLLSKPFPASFIVASPAGVRSCAPLRTGGLRVPPAPPASLSLARFCKALRLRARCASLFSLRSAPCFACSLRFACFGFAFSALALSRLALASPFVRNSVPKKLNPTRFPPAEAFPPAPSAQGGLSQKPVGFCSFCASRPPELYKSQAPLACKCFALASFTTPRPPSRRERPVPLSSGFVLA